MATAANLAGIVLHGRLERIEGEIAVRAVRVAMIVVQIEDPAGVKVDRDLKEDTKAGPAAADVLSMASRPRSSWRS